MVALVASLGLLGVSTFVVDSLMLYCCQHKREYYNDKYDYTQTYANDPRLSITKRQRDRHKKEEEENMITNDIPPSQPGMGIDYAAMNDTDISSGGYNSGNMYNDTNNQGLLQNIKTKFNM